MKRIIYLICLTVFLSACGGGGSSSGGGASNGSPGPTKYAGNYRGKVTATGSLGGQSETFTYNAAMRIENDGRVTMGVDSGAAGSVCMGSNTPIYINGNVIPWSGSGTCFIPDVGNCTVNLNGSIQMSGNQGIGETKGTITCGADKINVVYSAGFTKT